MPRVSVIMPAYNAENFIGEAIDSILQQSYQDFELIVVDDASSDATLEVAGNFKDPRIRIHANPRNMGIAATVNLAIALSDGEFIARMDNDDIAVADRLRMQVERLDDDLGITALGGQMEAFGKIERLMKPPVSDGDIKAYLFVAAGNILNPTSMIRAEFVRSNHLRFNPTWKGADDYAFWCDCMRFGAKFENLPVVLVRYRWHGGNYSGRPGLITTDVRRIRRELLQDFFPRLSGEEVGVLLRVFADPSGLDLNEVEETLQVISKAKLEKRSFYGENRTTLNGLIDWACGNLLREVGLESV